MATQQTTSKDDSELSKRQRRLALREINLAAYTNPESPSKAPDSSLKRHTALIKRIRQSMAYENRDQILKELETLTLEKYLDEIVGAISEGVLKCKTDRDVWSAVEVISAFHRRFPKNFTPAVDSSLLAILAPPAKVNAVPGQSAEQKEKEDVARITRQRPVLRICAELGMVGVWRSEDGTKSGGEGVIKLLRDLLSHDPSLSSLPLLITFVKSFARPYLGTNAGEAAAEPTPSEAQVEDHEQGELVERETREKLRRMTENYYDTVSKKLVQAHLKLQEQDRKNHEAYIRSGEIFEDRQQAYEKMTKNYEKLLSSVQSLSEVLSLPMPDLPKESGHSESIILGDQGLSHLGGDDEEWTSTNKWEDEEERRFYEDIIDLKDWVPRSILGIEEEKKDEQAEAETPEKSEDEEKKLEEEMQRLDDKEETATTDDGDDDGASETGSVTPTRSPSPVISTLPAVPEEQQQSAGPAALMTALLARLPDATNRELIDQAAIDFAFLNSKAARKRLIKFMGQIPRERIDIIPYYSRFITTLNKYMPDVGAGVVEMLEDQFRFLQKRKKIVKELENSRAKNVAFLSALTKHRVVPSHLILHIFKVFLDDFNGPNVGNVARLLEGCGRFLLRSEDTKRKMAELLGVMKRKQSLQHFDERQMLMLENAFYQCNPPERGPREVKQRDPMDAFIRHLVYDVLSKKTVDKVLRLLRKLHWEDPQVVHWILKVFTKVWKLRYASISLLAMLACDLKQYHPDFCIALVDQVLEDIRRGLEVNIFKWNQRRIASVKYLAELYNYRFISSNIIFDTLWLLVTFGHPDGRPLPGQPVPIDAPDDFFRVRLVCTILDACGMCFEKGAGAQRLDAFLPFFLMYVHCKEAMPVDVDFMITDTIEALRPKMAMFKTYDEAAAAVNEIFRVQAQKMADGSGVSGYDSDGDDDEERPDVEDEEEDGDRQQEDETQMDRPEEEEAPVLLHQPEPTGPSEEDDAEFAKELAKMISDAGENRKVDRRTAMTMWESTVMPGNLRRRRDSVNLENGKSEPADVMKFTLLSKKGNRPQTHELNVPASSDLATQTHLAQLREQQEQQDLKRLVLDYGQREEEEDVKSLETSIRNRGIRVNYGR
ncbi:ARM repeat-containing protein [Dacryopinax primogenitus]|uniref:ARM repeat-containing protein n=1 Tax=Dacryopinax primogenitus (strain DJM 731) TaxID=1858805 RepID=M5GD75_DACPD|nr:ARM repeat-containing protein [Dacryopinax primogenitus]EJU04317.1 ARM repeat-containing protein [Dacryopinax primogenitus]